MKSVSFKIYKIVFNVMFRSIERTSLGSNMYYLCFISHHFNAVLGTEINIILLSFLSHFLNWFLLFFLKMPPFYNIKGCQWNSMQKRIHGYILNETMLKIITNQKKNNTQKVFVFFQLQLGLWITMRGKTKL